jgi:uncharacterized protein YndB with AHSA1/START domain
MMRMTIALLAFVAGPALAAAPVTVSRQVLEGGAHALSHEVVVEAPVDKVWTAISSAEGWEGWAVPVAWDQTPEVIETSYDKAAKPGDKTTIRQQILFRAPRRLMLFRTIKAPQGFPDFDTYAKVTSLFELEPLGDNRTRVRLTGSGYADSEAGRKLLAFFEAGNKVSLERLRDSFPTSAPASVAAPLAPLQFLVGQCWQAPIGGDGQVDRHCFEPLYGGKHLRDRHVVTNAAGKVTYEGETIYAFNGKARRIEYAYFSSDGGVSYGSVSAKDGGKLLDFGDETFNGPDGKELKMSTEWRRVGDDAYESVSKAGFMPTGKRVTRYERVR